MTQKTTIENLKKYRFEFRHLTVLFIVLVLFQLLLSFIQKSSLKNFLFETQKWYQRYAAENMANLTSTSLELLIENMDLTKEKDNVEKQKIIQSFNIIFSQQLLQQNVEDICLVVTRNDSVYSIDEGALLFDYLTHTNKMKLVSKKHLYAEKKFMELRNHFEQSEEIKSILVGKNTFHIFVPFIPKGEFQGVLYIKKTPDFSLMTKEVIASYDEATIIYLSLIVLGLLAMYYISSFTVKERDAYQKRLFEENERHIKEQIVHEKESLFTKRIYHTHHKAEKIMGFIKEDLRLISTDNLESTKERVKKYSNFISRVIYDMKWFDPPLQTIRNQIFNTNINDTIKFLVDHVFLRISSHTEIFVFDLNLDPRIPPVHINEFVVWEILEPLIQNSIDHADVEKISIKIETFYDEENNKTIIKITDNGKGISEELLEKDEVGIRKLFYENITTRQTENQNSGYGCYIAYEIGVKRCGWEIDAYNNQVGCTFEIRINNN